MTSYVKLWCVFSLQNWWWEEAKCDSTPWLDCIALTIEIKTHQFWIRNNFCSAWHFNMDRCRDVQGLTVVGGAQQWGEYIHWWDFKNTYIETYTNIKTNQKAQINPTFPLLPGLCSPTSQSQQNLQSRCKSVEKVGHSSVLPVLSLHIVLAVD